MSKSIALTEKQINYALLLIERFAIASFKRRTIEQAAGYPKIYGGDAQLLVEAKMLLDSPKIKERLLRTKKANS